MPKSGQSRKRHGAHARKKTAARSQTVKAVGQPVSREDASAIAHSPHPAAAGQPSRTVGVPAANVKMELRRTAILTAILLVILVVLSRFLA